MNDEEWVTLEVGNDWMVIFYTLPGERLNAHGTNDTQNAVLLEEGRELSVRFPDGAVETRALVARRVATRASDHGHRYDVTQVQFGVNVEVHGILVWVPIECVQVRRSALQRRRDLVPSPRKATDHDG